MIVDKVRLDSQPINGDAPPAYEASVSPLPSTSVPEVKRPTRSSILIAAKSPQVATSWFNFASPTARQVRATVLGLVRDLVKLQPNDQSDVAISILKSCADACAANNLSINTVLQERSVEGHTPLYWAIIRRPAESAEKDTPDLDLLTALLTLATPLTPATTSDIRLACLLTSNQVLFQRLRTSPEFAPLSATDEMILDATMSLDDILVEDVGGDIGAFAVDFAILRFQKRMRVSKCAILEFIARGRMFRLSFNVATHEHRRPSLPPPGTWYAALSLLEQSPPTWLDSRLLVPAPLEPDVKETGAGGLFGTGKARPRPTLSLRMRTKQQLHPRRGGHGNEIIVSLDGSEAAGGMASLQYAGCPYIAADETLHGRLEASLIRPEAECVIC
ncbi:hypothetical protein FB451DRAFT_1291287 [Mycena latifolia]|nr:hypothetical protein FB451DRAFT_1291287 [Mycena latifolia]